MYIKKYWEHIIIDLSYLMKGIGFTKWFPVFVVYGGIGLSDLIVWVRFYDLVKVCNLTRNMIYTLIPFFSIWWLASALEQLVEEPISELLMIEYKGRMTELHLLYLGYHIMILPPFLIYTQWLTEPLLIYIEILIIDYFYFSILLFGSYMIRRIMVPVIIVFIHSVLFTFERTMGIEALRFMVIDWNETDICMIKAGIYLSLSVSLSIAVAFLNRKSEGSLFKNENK